MRLVRRDDAKSCVPRGPRTCSLFRPGIPLVVRRAPLLAGLHTHTAAVSGGLHRKFQRPFEQKRRAKEANHALQVSSLGQKRRMNGMAKLLARAGRGLFYKLPVPNKGSGTDDDDESGDSDDDDEAQDDRPFEPMLLWQSPYQILPNNDDTDGDGTAAAAATATADSTSTATTPTSLDLYNHSGRGLPGALVKEMRADEYGIEEEVTVVKSAPLTAYSKQNVFVPPVLAKWLRPHQREGVQFMYQCVMGLKDFKGHGCILADDMGLGKTLQSVTLIYTLLKTSIKASGEPTAKRVIVVCPCSLVNNWANEFVKWLGPNVVKVLALAEGDRKSVERDIDSFVKTKIHNILVASYECMRTHIKRFIKYRDCCDLLVCDEAHRLKNSENQTSRALNSLPVQRRVLLTGTPMQNDLTEFYAMVDFTNPGILGTPEDFRRHVLFPILRGREPDATDAQKRKMMEIQNEMSQTVNEFILRRINTLNAQHLPPKLVQVVCCNLTEIQQNMYQHLVNSKDMQHVLDGKQVNCLASIQMLMKLVNHPSLVADEDNKTCGGSKNNNTNSGRRAASKQIKYTDDHDDKVTTAAPGADGIAKFLPYHDGGRAGPVHPEWSGKMYVLWRLMREMRKPGNGGDKIVIVSNFTQTLDLIGRMCRESSWGFCRLDGSISMKKRQKMVDEFNDPTSSLVAFLLSSKAGGCGLNLIGANRLVLFDPDWNPAVDKQAAARCWRDGQKKRCFTYRFLATGTVEEKIFQRQLSKEGLQSVVDDKEQVNALSTKDLRNLFKLRTGTPSDTHDKLKCDRCKIIHDNAEMEATKVLPKKLVACRALFDEMCQHVDASVFLITLDPTAHGSTKEEYEKLVKQPMDLEAIRKRLDQAPGQPSAYKNVSDFAKDVNRIFSNVVKVWEPGHVLADTSRRLQGWWIEKWTDLVPLLVNMKADGDDCNGHGEEVDSASAQDDDALEYCANVHNERGEDYQEQIGMPDEENMRKWSHHYSTDTVDDPVFRAAIRGCDLVSFVFGLEVTWSLIQQRQQEEEAKLAMEELEHLEEEAGDDDEYDTKPPAVTDSSTDRQGDSGDVEDSENTGIDEINCALGGDEDADANSANVQALEDSDNDMSRVDPSDAAGGSGNQTAASLAVAVGGGLSFDSPFAVGPDDTSLLSADEPTPEAEILESSPEGSGPVQADILEESSPEGSTVLAVLASSQSSKESSTAHPDKENFAQSAAATSNNKWACSSCTLENAKSRRKCTACGTKRPPAGKKRSFDQANS